MYGPEIYLERQNAGMSAGRVYTSQHKVLVTCTCKCKWPLTRLPAHYKSEHVRVSVVKQLASGSHCSSTVSVSACIYMCTYMYMYMYMYTTIAYTYMCVYSMYNVPLRTCTCQHDLEEPHTVYIVALTTSTDHYTCVYHSHKIHYDRHCGEDCNSL